MQKFLNEIANLRLRLQNGILLDEPMKNHTSFRIGGIADIFLRPASTDELEIIMTCIKRHDVPYVLIGNGSNVLVSDKGFRGVVVQVSKDCSKIEIVDMTECDMLGYNTTEDSVVLSVKAGTSFATIGQFALEHELTGFEALAGIPSTLGGGLVMNAGAYGTEIADILDDALIITETDLLILNKKDLELSYRHSNILEKEYWVLAACLQLQKGNREEIERKMKEFAQKRRDTQPLNYPSAGSTFKRPEGHFAGKLIEDCGLKGKRIGDAMVSEKHAGFLVNVGKASAADMYALICLCQEVVKREYGVDLELEVKLIGEF